MYTVFLVAAIVSVFFGIGNLIVITSYLQKHGIRVNMFLFRIYVFRYMRQYREITLKETGKVGAPYYLFIYGMNLAAVFVVLGLILRSR